MKKRYFTTLFILSLIILSNAILINTSYAQQTYEYTVLAPLPNTTKSCTGIVCKTDLQTYLPGLFKLAIGLSAVFAVLMIVIGGFQYISTDALQKKEDGKKRIENSVLGLLLVISAWLILSTINPNLTHINLSIDPITVKPVSGTGSTAGIPMTAAEIAASDAIRTQLQNAGILTYASPCAQGQTTGCVNLNGLPQSAQTGLVNLKSACSCSIVITGGTEAGHTSHGVGNPIVDVRLDPGLETFIKNNSGLPTQTSLGPLYTLNTFSGTGGSTFLKEANHWHIVFN